MVPKEAGWVGDGTSVAVGGIAVGICGDWKDGIAETVGGGGGVEPAKPHARIKIRKMVRIPNFLFMGFLFRKFINPLVLSIFLRLCLS
jgi:hypothetical protein